MDNDNVVQFPGLHRVSIDNNRIDLPVEAVLQGVRDNDVKELFVVGLDPNGDLYLASNVPSLSKFVYLLESAKLRLLSADFGQD